MEKGRLEISGIRFPPLQRGESVAINGVCLTLIRGGRRHLAFDVVPETLRRSNLGMLRPGTRVNIEFAVRAGQPMGGHYVQGHVDGIGHIREKRSCKNSFLTTIQTDPELIRFMFSKGSVAVDGVSLTLVDVQPRSFSVALIASTLEQTTLGTKGVGDSVNVEVDILAKYVAHFSKGQSEGRPKKGRVRLTRKTR
jgi:riboflavin synthase